MKDVPSTRLIRLQSLAGQLLVVLALLANIYFLLKVHGNFQSNCPERDVLSWDANLRYVTVLDQLRDLREGLIFNALVPYIKAPTWPMLRSFFSLLLAIMAGPDPAQDIYISVATFIILCGAMVWTAFYFLKDWLLAGISFLLTSALLIHTREISAYIFSSMLEVQGMLFILLSCQAALMIFAGRGGGLVFLFCLLAFQGLAHTKYPYALLFLPALMLVAALRSPGEYGAFFRALLRPSEKFRVVRYMVLLLTVILVFLATQSLKTRSAVICLAGLLALADFQFFLHKSRKSAGFSPPFSFKMLYYAGLLPFALWMLVSPDRIISVLDSQIHAQEEADYFVQRFFTLVFDQPLLAIFPLALFSGGAAAFIWRRNLTEQGKASLLILLALFLQIIILELFTKNKQMRHVYHLLPALLLFLQFSAFTLSAERSIKKGQLNWRSLQAFAGASILVFCAGIFFSAPGSLFGRDFINKRIYCFTGVQGGVYAPVRKMVNQIDFSENAMLVNAFNHMLAPPPGRWMTTEIELLMRSRALEAGFSIRAPGEIKNSRPPGALIFVRESCTDSFYDAELQKALGRPGWKSKRQLVQNYEPESGFCLSRYRLE
jgi:hypothetical protein